MKSSLSILHKKYNKIIILCILIVFILLINHFVVGIAIVSGDSMRPTLYDKDILIINKIGYTVNPGDIILIDTKQKPKLKEKAIVKRVIATENQTVQINFKTNTIMVDGIILDENYINYKIQDPLENNCDSNKKSYTVPKNSVFVLGDNRNFSLDSRVDYIGMIDLNNVIGNVVFVVETGKLFL